MGTRGNNVQVTLGRPGLPTGRGRTCGTLLLLLATAAAYGGNEDEIARCARIASTGDRILCLEEALRRARDRTGGAPAEAGPVETAETRGHDREDRRAAAANTDEPTGKGAAGVPAADVPVERPGGNVAASPSPAADADERFGLENTDRYAGSPNSIEVVVVAVEENVYGKLVYTTQEGQVWRQSDQRSPRTPELPFDAEIRRAAAGSFFLKPLSGGIAVRVQRRQ
jgi:hypothetical protein